MGTVNKEKFGKTLRQFIKFFIAGILNTLVDLGGFAALNTFGAKIFGREVTGFIMLAQVISYSFGMVNSWLINSSWTFEDRHFEWKKVMKFVIVNLLSLGINLLILTILCEVFHMEAFMAKLIATPFGLLVNFIGNRLFVFKPKDTNSFKK